MTAPTDTAVVLMIREGEVSLLRSVRGIRVELVNYDRVEHWLASDAMHADDPIPPVDARGEQYISSSPAVHCAACTDWIGDDEPRVSMGATHAARSYCLHCATAEPALRAFAREVTR
jgi:hypothetical protein